MQGNLNNIREYKYLKNLRLSGYAELKNGGQDINFSFSNFNKKTE